MTLTDANGNLLFDEGDELDKLIDPIATKAVEIVPTIAPIIPNNLNNLNNNNNNNHNEKSLSKSVSDYESNSSNTSSSFTLSSFKPTNSSKTPSLSSGKPFTPEVVWVKATFLTALHLLALYGITLAHKAKLATFFFSFAVGILSGIGVQCGAHRLWSHKAFKAKLGLRIFLAACQTMAGQKNIYYWVRDHRVHHKYSDTDADPHNSHRGFWFAHMGWIYLKKHPLVLEKGNQLDMSDIEADPVVMFQQKYYVPLLILFWGVIPAAIPVIFWNESLLLSILGCVFFRHVYMLNVTGLVNSYAHMFGYRPYDTRIRPAESTYVRHLMMGEGFHNYHHTFPWDYSASELGSLDVFNPATAAIDFFHAMGWAYDLRKPTPAMVANRIKGHGDQVEAELHRTSSVCEWAAGLAMVFAPWFAIRWVLISVMGS